MIERCIVMKFKLHVGETAIAFASLFVQCTKYSWWLLFVCMYYLSPAQQAFMSDTLCIMSRFCHPNSVPTTIYLLINNILYYAGVCLHVSPRRKSIVSCPRVLLTITHIIS